MQKTAIFNTVLLFVLFFMVGCATSPDKIPAEYVSPFMYEDYSCKKLLIEEDRLSHKISALHASLDKTASNDSIQMGIGLILFWPALFFLEGGDGPQAVEYARLKGESEAIYRAQMDKECPHPKINLESKTDDESKTDKKE